MPFFRFPFFYNPSYYNGFSNFNNYNTKLHNNSYSSNGNKSNIQQKANHQNQSNFYNNNNSAFNSMSSKSVPINNESVNSKKNDFDTNCDDYFFEIFGLKLFFDDVLLICIIFFLYQEGVKDNELFLSLILLLLT